ncbi:MAG: PEP-CTERM sorting domain-containing protein [Phycisphaerae bacterium]|nr:PEP-CTERM sorting domain-containing protein [Phycisphaerae bacterium]
MRTALIIAGSLSLATFALADVRIFVTPAQAGHGLTDPTLAFTPTLSTVLPSGEDINAYDFYYYACHSYPPVDAPSGTTADPIRLVDGDFGYVWLQFRGEPKSSKINGLQITIREVGQSEPAADIATCWYVLNGGFRKRWDGAATPPSYPEWHNNPQTLACTRAYGIVNSGDDAHMLFDHQTDGPYYSGVTLLGSVYDLPAMIKYEILITEISYASGEAPEVSGGVFWRFVPEPTSLMLLVLAGLVIRRR